MARSSHLGFGEGLNAVEIQQLGTWTPFICVYNTVTALFVQVSEIHNCTRGIAEEGKNQWHLVGPSQALTGGLER